MNKERFSTYLHQPELMNEQSLTEVRKIVDDYPYFTAGRIMLLRNLHMSNDSDYDLELPLTAIYAGNRAILYNYIFAKDIAQTEASVQTQKNLEEATITKSETPEIQGEKIQAEENVTVPTVSENIEAKNTNDAAVTPAPKQEEHVSKTAEPISSAAAEQTNNDHSVHSFAQWLEIMSHKKTQATHTPQTDVPHKKSWDLIDNFIQESPRISQGKGSKGKDTTPANLADKSVTLHEDFMTETLAKIYIKQKHYEKAIQIFKKLSLKYPEKSIYFAGQIKIVEQLLNNKK